MSFRNYYDTSSYSRGRDSGRATSAASDRPTSVTAKYIPPTPSYKSSSIPVLSDRNTESPIATIANKYANYNKNESKYDKKEKPTSKYEKKDYISKNDKPTSKYEKKDYSLLSVPSLNKSRDVSPVSTSSKYSIGRTSRHISPDRKTTKSFKDKSRDPSPADRDKDIPNKTDKSSGYSLSTYKLYPRASSYTRSSKVDTKPEISVNRYAIANRLSNNYLRSPTPVKRSSISPVNHLDSPKSYIEKSVSPTIIIEEPCSRETLNEEQKPAPSSEMENGDHDTSQETETVTIITRHTSPTPPGSSAYVRSRRADMAKTIEKTVTRIKRRPEMVDKEIQSDRLDDPTRSGRYSSMARTNLSNWTYYTPSSTNYTGYAGRYSTQYSNLREGSVGNYSDRSSRSRSTEPPPYSENTDSNSYSESNRSKEIAPQQTINLNTDTNPEIITVYEQSKDEDTSEIIINVNLKLKKTKSPSVTEMVSPEVTISNSQLPPQAPKADGTPKTKKIKARKSSDSASDTPSKKKVVKKRSKSVSSTDSDQCSEKSDKSKESSPKGLSKNSSGASLPNGTAKNKHSKSRQSNSPESSVTLSTQSSISEDDTVSKSKTLDVSRTSADEVSIPTDRSGKQSSPQKNDTEDAKSFLIRALAPVTNLFKIRHPESSENSKWLDSSSESTGRDVSNLLTETDKSRSKSNTDNIIASNDDNVVRLKSIRHLESGEKPWWQESSESEKRVNGDSSQLSSEKNIPRKINRIESGERAWWMESNSEKDKSDKKSSQSNDSSGKPVNGLKYDDEKPWWLDSCANIPEGIERLTPPRKSSSDSDKSEKFNFFKVRKIESGDKKDWWVSSNENSSSNNKRSDSQSSITKSSSDKNFSLRRIRHIDSGERPWWLSSDKNIPEGIEKLPTPPRQEESDSSDSEEMQVYVPATQIPPFPLNLPDDEPLGDRRSPEGLETPKESENYHGRSSPYENNRQFRRHSSSNGQFKKEKYISRYTDIDDILGTSGQICSPFMESVLARRTGQVVDEDECEEIDPTQVRIHDSTAQMPVIKKLRCRSEIIDYRDEDQLDDATLQVFKDGDYGSYLDLDSTLGEQEEELEGLQDSRKNALVLRTQLSVRVHAIIERLLHSQGRELRRALFTLKQILQSDKDLVHEFIANKGLDCLMQVSQMSDQNYLDYILRALGQILLYVDGMHGVMAHKPCLQWLYTLIASKYRHIVKTALKLLVVFVEYTEKNSLLLVDAINTVDNANGRLPWYNIMKILQDFDASDTELLIYATTVINRCLNNLPDRDMYYDQVDALQDQGMDEIIQRYMSKQGTDLDLLRQLQIFDAVLNFEDGDESGNALKQLDESIISSVRRRSINLNSAERRRSKKDSIREKAESPELSPIQSPKIIVTSEPEPESKLSNNLRQQILPSLIDNKENKEFTSALRRRRDRFARQAHHIIQQQELLNNGSNIYNGIFGKTNGTVGNGAVTNGTVTNGNISNGNLTNGSHTNSNGHYGSNNGTYISTNGTYPTTKPTYPAINGKHNCTNGTYVNGNGIHTSLNGSNGGYIGTNGNHRNQNGESHRYNSNGKDSPEDEVDCAAKPAKNINIAEVIMNGNQRYTAGLKQRIQNGTLGHSVNAVDALTVMRQKQIDGTEGREHSIKDLAQRLTSPVSPTSEDKQLRVSDMAGIVSKAKEELAKSQSKEIIKSPTIEKTQKVHEIKVSENDLHWEELKKGCLNRAYHLCDLDFSDLQFDSDEDAISPAVSAANGPPPPPPSMFPSMNAPPPLPTGFPPPIPKNNIPAPPPKPALSAELSNDSDSSTIKKNKKTVKLFWREIQENPVPVPAKTRAGGLIWDDLPEIRLDTNMLEHLFESRTNDLIIKEKLMEPKRNLILDAKRSNAINIAMKKLPTPQTIKAAIMKMDATVIGREGIEKLLSMLPTEEEKIKIQEAQYANPDLPLGSAEQFLLTLASINELSSRLKLWVFKWDFDNLEKEIAEPLMDLKHGIELLKVNKTFKVILSTLRSVGSFLNGSQVKGFRLEYLSKVMEVKDTVHKHPLLYHICEMIIEKFPDSTDFFSEVGPVIRASKVDFDMQSANLLKLETDCKASWDHMKRVAKHDGSQIFKTKINEFLTDAAERIILLSIIKRRVMNRYNKFLLYLGIPPGDVSKTKPSELLKVIAEFALEYRTTRERVLQQLEKRANHRERNKTRGKMIIDVGNFSHKNGDNTADHALKELLKTDPDPDSLTEGRRQRLSSSKNILVNGDLSAEDAIMESLARSATPRRRPAPRRRRALPEHNHLNRTLDGHS